MHRCPTCRKEFPNKQALYGHTRIHGGAPAATTPPASSPEDPQGVEPEYVAAPVQPQPPVPSASVDPPAPPLAAAAPVSRDSPLGRLEPAALSGLQPVPGLRPLPELRPMPPPQGTPELRPPAPESAPYLGQMPPPPRVAELAPPPPVRIDTPTASEDASGGDGGAPPGAATAPSPAAMPAPRQPSQVAVAALLQMVIERLFPTQPLTVLEKSQLQAACDTLLPHNSALAAVLAVIVLPRLFLSPTVQGWFRNRRPPAPAAPASAPPAPAAPAPAPAVPAAPMPAPAARAPTAEEIAASYHRQDQAFGVPSQGVS